VQVLERLASEERRGFGLIFLAVVLALGVAVSLPSAACSFPFPDEDLYPAAESASEMERNAADARGPLGVRQLSSILAGRQAGGVGIGRLHTGVGASGTRSRERRCRRSRAIRAEPFHFLLRANTL
jgi:hypothetical protein